MTDKEKKEKKEIAELENEVEEDFDFSEVDYSDDQDSFEARIKKLREKLKECEKQKQEYLDGWQRLRADVANENKRRQEELLKAKDSGIEVALHKILPALDSFDSAFKGEFWENLDDTWKQGIGFIYKQFLTALEELGVQELGKEGESFDPSVHEAIKELETNEKDKDHTVSKVIRKGYKIKNKVIRPAQVEIYVFKGG